MAKELPAEEIAELWNNGDNEDIHINEHGDTYYGKKLIVSHDADGNADWKAIRKWCKDSNYFPNVWQVNDHGNLSLFTWRGRYLGGIV